VTAAAPDVVAWADAGGDPQPVRAFLERLDELGWLRPPEGRTIVQVGRRGNRQEAQQTAGALLGYLSEHGHDVDVHDGADAPALEQTIGVAGVGLRGTLVVPRFWFEPGFVVTVVGVGRVVDVGLASILDAQADALRRPENPWTADQLAYEAHRLARSDLCIGCGVENPAQSRWWLAGPSDVAVDRVLALAAGRDALPPLRAVYRHEVRARDPEVEGVMPRLGDLIAPAWLSEVHAAPGRARALGHGFARDVVAVRSRLRRLPNAAWRRLAPRLRGRRRS
jgi:hypothetical protein